MKPSVKVCSKKKKKERSLKPLFLSLSPNKPNSLSRKKDYASRQGVILFQRDEGRKARLRTQKDLR